MAEDITNGELARRIDAVMAELRRIEDRYATREAHEALKARVDQTEMRIAGAVRMAWGGLILPILVALFVAFILKGAGP